MALEIKQQLRQTQQLVMTPQLQQAIKLLQFNHLEMVTAVEQEMVENPLLEAASYDDPFTEKEIESRNDLDALEDTVREPERPERDVLDPDWENYLDSYGGDYSPAMRDFSDQRPLENRASSKENLFDHLLEQLHFCDLDEGCRRIALEIIGNLDENGYLDVSLEELSRSSNGDADKVRAVLAEVQKFDPRGIAARDLRECLLIQARALEPLDHLAVRILEEAFDSLHRGKIDEVARKLKVSAEHARAAVRVISALNPRPGGIFANSDTVYIVPDIFVIKLGNEYSIVLNDDGLPRLRISSFYQQALHSGISSPGAKDYIQEKMRAAVWLIKSIHQRQRTIYKVTQSIIKFQRAFFDKGIDYLKPLILKDVADDVEMHESTISRVTTNKYIHTPRGIFELKYFFNSGIRHGSDAIASESVKNQILRIVKAENLKRPASDKQIVEELARSNIYIARRTVAKYRDILGIPPSSRRKKKF
jgi:RNA polymerase sigma-54 factor